jgi:hypothetical protein
MAYAHLIIQPAVSNGMARPLDSFGASKPAVELPPLVLPRQSSRLVL